MLLATHPDVQRKVREEVMTSVPSGDHLLQWSDIEKLSYLTAVIKEAQRLQGHTLASSNFEAHKLHFILYLLGCTQQLRPSIARLWKMTS